MNIWNSDLSTAPRGKTVTHERRVGDKIHEIRDFVPDFVWLATKCGKVLRSYWIPENGKNPGRWAGLATGEQPLAWQPYNVPEHPDHTNTDAAISGHRFDGPQAANRSEDEALRGMASGGVQDECAIHPANHFILDDCGSGA
jgi:hypothetical protein